MSERATSADQPEFPGPVREPIRLVAGGAGSVSALLTRMEASAFQGRKLGEAFRVWRRMIDGGSLICVGLAGSVASAGLAPLVAWLVERGYANRDSIAYVVRLLDNGSVRIIGPSLPTDVVADLLGKAAQGYADSGVENAGSMN